MTDWLPETNRYPAVFYFYEMSKTEFDDRGIVAAKKFLAIRFDYLVSKQNT